MDDTRFFETVDGVIVPRMTPERREELKAYPLRSGDVFIATYPRSGTTWTQHIVRLLRSGGVDDGTVLDVAGINCNIRHQLTHAFPFALR